MKPSIFKDKKTQDQFDRDGYVVIDFISPEEAKTIAKKFYEIHTGLPKGFYSDAFNPDDSTKQDIFSHTEKIFQEVVDEKFSNIKKLGSTFLCKAPGEEGKVDVHQDWSVVDETKYYSATIWVPTIDTTPENGALRVLPGSHLFFDAYRGPSLDFCYRDTAKLLWDNMITVPMKAGQAFVLNHAVIHGSGANTSNKERLAIAYGLIPKETNLVFYHKKDEGKVEKFEMPDNFFNKYYNIPDRPLIGKVIDEFDYSIKQASPLKVSQLIDREASKRNTMPLFKNKAIQEGFEKDGYAKISLLDQEEVKTLLDFYHSLALNDDAGYGFHISMDQQDKKFVKTILDKLFDVALPKLETQLLNTKAFVGSFVIKEPNPKSVVPVHQDWSFVEDEEQHCSATCWISLVDVNIDNGALGVIKGSHHYFKNFRPSPSPQVPSPISEHMFAIFPYLQLIEMKAGEALIFDNRTFHGSPPNTTDKPRIAFGIGITQKEAKLVHYYLKPDEKENKILKYNIDPDFFLKYENSRLSKMYDKKELIIGYELESEVPYVLPEFTKEELIEVIKSTGNEFNVPMCEKLAKLFSYNMDGSAKESKAELKEETTIPKEVLEPQPWVWVDNRPFIEKYSPLNIAREMKKRFFAAT
jgi:ectoine hydroxylase-related dioxygenase (phytanoyl-CoA dioxygenase family)